LSGLGICNLCISDKDNIFLIKTTKDFPKESQNFYEVAICYDMARNKKLALEWYTLYSEKMKEKIKSIRELTKQESEFLGIAEERMQLLRTDLFFEGEQMKK
jgi:hypothetical protein